MNQNNLTINSSNLTDSADYIIKIIVTNGINTNKTESGKFNIVNSTVVFLSDNGGKN